VFSSGEANSSGFFAARRTTHVRSFWTMGKALAPQQDAGTTPAGVHIRTFETGRDERHCTR